jgi:hypothetical protein
MRSSRRTTTRCRATTSRGSDRDHQREGPEPQFEGQTKPSSGTAR